MLLSFSVLNKHLIQKFMKNLFIVTMLCLNIGFIAIPSIKRFLEQGIFIEVSTESPERLDFPSVTIARIGLDGW